MRIGILGAGQVGTALATLLSRAGHQITAGVRDPERSPAHGDYRIVGLEEAATQGEIVILAVPYTACADLLPNLATTLKNKIVIDATNPLQADWSPLPLGAETSAGEEIARLLPDSNVVKAFNTVFADIMTPEHLDRGGAAVTAFVAGDVDDATALVAKLAKDAGFAPQVVGPLRMSRYLESMAHLNIHIAVGLGQGTQAGFIYR